VGEAEVERAREVVVEIAEGLPGDGVDEIDGVPGDAGGAGELDRTGDVGGVVPAFEGLEVVGVEGLGADADAVDAAGDEGVEELGRGGLGVALDGPLGELGEVEVLVEGVEESAPEVDAEEGGGAASNEDGADGVGGGREGGEFTYESVGEGRLSVAGIDDGVEVAVVALVEAEGDVEIEGPRAGRVGVEVAEGRSGGGRRADRGSLLGQVDGGIVGNRAASGASACGGRGRAPRMGAASPGMRARDRGSGAGLSDLWRLGGVAWARAA